MKKMLAITLLLTTVLAFTFQKKTRIIFFGDSITELGMNPGGYVMRIDSMCRLEKKNQQYDFIGAGVGGNKIYDLYLRLEDDVLSKNPDVVIIYIGVNDVWHKALVGTGTDQDRFEKFYNAILKKLKAKNIKAMLCTPAVIGERNDMSNQQDGDLNRYSNIIRDIAKKNNLPLVDLRQKFLDYLDKNNPDNQEKGILTTDRVHMNARGNKLIAELIWNAIKNM